MEVLMHTYQIKLASGESVEVQADSVETNDSNYEFIEVCQEPMDNIVKASYQKDYVKGYHIVDDDDTMPLGLVDHGNSIPPSSRY